ncbi:MAG: diaminopimelate epimerase [Solirubrobacteraceae bacterium]
MPEPTVPFEKWQALGNDYVIVEERALPFELTSARVARICAPHTGVGSDGVLVLSRPRGGDAVAALRIFNPDGSEAELSGNGAREAIMYLRRRGWTERDSFTLETAAGPVRPRITGAATCTVQMGRAATASPFFPGGPADGRGEVDLAGAPAPFRHVAIGNPQCAIALPDAAAVDALDLHAAGPAIERDARFPARTNVSFYAPLPSGGGAQGAGHDGSRIRARIFERGVGETMSSGTGASGAAVAHVLAGGHPPVVVALDGGELSVDVSPELDVTLTGWAVPVYRGELDPDFVKELHATE